MGNDSFACKREVNPAKTKVFRIGGILFVDRVPSNGCLTPVRRYSPHSRPQSTRRKIVRRMDREYNPYDAVQIPPCGMEKMPYHRPLQGDRTADRSLSSQRSVRKVLRFPPQAPLLQRTRRESGREIRVLNEKLILDRYGGHGFFVYLLTEKRKNYTLPTIHNLLFLLSHDL